MRLQRIITLLFGFSAYNKMVSNYSQEVLDMKYIKRDLEEKILSNMIF